jgi:Domain of unknown function (DUF4160)
MHLEDDLKRHRLALVDLLTERRAQPYKSTIELLVIRLGPLKVKMYQEPGHNAPHVHIDYGPRSHVASYSINDGERLAGTLDAKYDRAMLPNGLLPIGRSCWRHGRRCGPGPMQRLLLASWRLMTSSRGSAVLKGRIGPLEGLQTATMRQVEFLRR